MAEMDLKDALGGTLAQMENLHESRSGDSSSGEDSPAETRAPETEEERVAKRWRGRMEVAGIPPRYQEAHLATNCANLESSIGKDQTVAQARNWARDGSVTQRGRDRFCVLIAGGYGVGKTWLATAAFKELLWRSPAGIWRKFHAFVREIQGCYSDASPDRVDEVLRRYQRTPVLMLDDVGDLLVGSETEDRRRLLYEVLDVRNDYLLPTIITTNLNDQELAEQFGERTFERMKEMSALVGMAGKNYRD